MRHSVVVLSSEYPPNVCGGLGTHVAALTSVLADSVDVHVFTPPAPARRSVDRRVRLHAVAPFAGARDSVEFWLRFCEAALSRVARECPGASLVHCHEWMTVPAGIRIRDVLRIPLLFNVHLPQLGGPPLHAENLGLSEADAVLVNSRASKAELDRRRLAPRAIRVIPNGVDLDVFRPGGGWPDDEGYILFVGRLVPQKGVEVLLRAFAALLRRIPDARLRVVGDGHLQLYLKRMARRLGIGRWVTFADWRVGSELVRLYQSSRFVVVPSRYEPFGIVALEAMACARPVIASRVGGLREFVARGGGGLLFPESDHLELARCMARLMVDPALRSAMGRAARRTAGTFDWRHVGAQTLRVYDGLRRRGCATSPRSPRRAPLTARWIESLQERLRPVATRLLSNDAAGGRAGRNA